MSTRLLGVPVVAGIQIPERAPQPLALLALRVAGTHVPRLAPDGHLRARGRLEVQIPERVPGCATLRRDHDVPVAGPRVQERRGTRLTALAAGGRQEQDRHLADPPADLTPGQPVDTDVHAPEDPEFQVRHCSSRRECAQPNLQYGHARAIQARRVLGKPWPSAIVEAVRKKYLP